MDNNSKNKIKNMLAEHLGIEASDINDTDSLLNDLHMDPTEITDFTKLLEDSGIDISKVDLMEIETFEDLSDALDAN